MSNKVLEALGDVVRQHIKAKWKSPLCVLCGENKWTVRGMVFPNLALSIQYKYSANPDNSKKTAPVIYAIGVQCRNCGNLHLIEAYSTGREDIESLIIQSLNETMGIEED